MPRKAVSPTASLAHSSSRPRRRILVLGSVRESPEILRECDGATAVIAPFATLDAGLLIRSRPDTILVPLIGTGHDLADVAERLAGLGYRGTLRGYCRPVPKREEVLQALTEAFPDIAVDMVELRR